MEESDDAAVVARCLAGERGAFAGLVVRYEKPVYNVALRMLRNPEDARDVTQTVFLKAFEGLGGYDPGFRFYSWIYRIAINESLDVLRARKRQGGDVDEQTPSGQPGPEAVVAGSDEERAVIDAIDGLKPDYRAVVALKYFADRSYEEISAILGIEVKMVKSRLFTARQLIRDTLMARGALG